jgi:rhamnosyltransferase
MLSEVACVIVFFNPTDASIDTVAALAGFPYPVVVVVNQASSKQVAALMLLNHVHVIQNMSNLGLAKALNQGLGFAFDELNVRYVIAFDQDSVPEPSLPQSLAFELAAAGSDRVACIGPVLVDRKSMNTRYAYDPQAGIDKLEPRTIPTSGTLFTREAWREVGPMLEPLFIDGIDHEWCFRAYSKGYRVAVSRDVTLLHDMGDAGIRFMGRFKPIHRSPIRHYFIIRNTVYLCSLGYIPKSWKLSELLKTIRRIAVYLAVSADRIKSLRLMCRGLRDGFSGRLGPCPIQ